MKKPIKNGTKPRSGAEACSNCQSKAQVEQQEKDSCPGCNSHSGKK